MVQEEGNGKVVQEEDEMAYKRNWKGRRRNGKIKIMVLQEKEGKGGKIRG